MLQSEMLQETGGFPQKWSEISKAWFLPVSAGVPHVCKVQNAYTVFVPSWEPVLLLVLVVENQTLWANLIGLSLLAMFACII